MAKKATKKKAAVKAGRPSGFGERVALTILELAKAGKTDAQIAAAVGISPTTLNNWKAQHPDFLAALKSAKQVADELVEGALFSRAVGYRMPAVKFFWNSKGGPDGKGAVEKVAYVEQVPPDTTACIFWLKNRRRDMWRDVSKHELTGADGAPLPQIIITLPANGREAT